MNAPPNPATSALSISDLRFDWTPDQALIDLPHLSLERGASLLLGGPSGSGKSTLLNLIGGVIPVAQGRISVNGTDLAALSGSQRDRFRAEHLGIIFQQFNLLPFLGVIDNVLLPLRFAPQRRARVGADEASCRRHAQTLLEQLGVPEGRWSAAVRDLSVGQQQRVAAARALIGAPTLILADEPTSALDPDNRDRFLELLLMQSRVHGSAVLLVSHDPAIAHLFDGSLSLAKSASLSTSA